MLGDDEFRVAWAEGQSMTLEQVVNQIPGAAGGVGDQRTR
jgi:hypothetical protein